MSKIKLILMKSKKIVLTSGILVGGYFLRKYIKGGVNTHEPDLKGKTVIVTGGNSGIGMEAARKFHELNAKVIITGRSEKKAQEFLDSLEMKEGREEVLFFKVDFSDLEEVNRFYEDIVKEIEKVDILVNNAGGMVTEYNTTKQGLEVTMGVNHLSHFYLTSLLMPQLIKAEKSRVINVSSMAHQNSYLGNKPNFEDYWFNKEKIDLSKKGFFGIYGESKLANILFSKAMDQKINEVNKFRDMDQGLKIKTAALHPGVVLTEFTRFLDDDKTFSMLKPLFLPIAAFFMKDSVDGAQTTLHCSLIPWEDLESGGYFKDCEICEPKALAKDPSNAEMCWKLSSEKIEELLGQVTFQELRVEVENE